MVQPRGAGGQSSPAMHPGAGRSKLGKETGSSLPLPLLCLSGFQPGLCALDFLSPEKDGESWGGRNCCRNQSGAGRKQEKEQLCRVAGGRRETLSAYTVLSPAQ